VEGPAIWQTRSKAQEGQYYMVLQDDGKLAIFRGEDPEHSKGLVRRMRPRYAKKPSKNGGARRALGATFAPAVPVASERADSDKRRSNAPRGHSAGRRGDDRFRQAAALMALLTS
jgi:hypothetical protein